MSSYQRRAQQARCIELRKAAWARRENLRESHACNSDPIEWLFRRAGGRTHAYYGDDAYHQEGWFDHGSRWLRDSKPYLLLGQPYDLSEDDLRAFARYAKLGLSVKVGREPSWHYPGNVLSVIVTRA